MDEYLILRANPRTNVRDLLVQTRGSADDILDTSDTNLVTVSLDPQDLRSIREDPAIRALAPVMPLKLVKPTAVSLPADTRQRSGAWGRDLVRGKDSPFSGNGVVVGILDTGIDADHEAFRGTTLIKRNFTDSSSDDDEDGHGTHCAGTLFGKTVTGFDIGVAPGVERALIGKIVGTAKSSTPALFGALEWAFRNSCDIVSISVALDYTGYLGSLVDAGQPAEVATANALSAYGDSLRFFDAFTSLMHSFEPFGRKCAIIAAAGNESRTTPVGRWIASSNLPARARGIISVGAVGMSGSGLKLADFSNGPADIAGPGIDTISANRGGGLISMSGTSMAAPHVAGALALWNESRLVTAAGLGQTAEMRLLAAATAQGLSATDRELVGAGVCVGPIAASPLHIS